MSERAEWRRRCVAAEVALTRLQQERDDALAERDAAVARADQTNANYNILKDDYRDLLEDKHRAVAHAEQAERERDEARLSNTVTEHHTIQQLSAALTEARRVLGRIEWVRIGGKMQPYCPFCWEQAKDGHTADCALAALLAQEEPHG